MVFVQKKTYISQTPPNNHITLLYTDINYYTNLRSFMFKCSKMINKRKPFIATKITFAQTISTNILLWKHLFFGNIMYLSRYQKIYTYAKYNLYKNGNG